VNARPAPAWRSLLYVPVNVERFVEGAHAAGADAIILDLEDAIAPSEKTSARTVVASAAARVSRAGADVAVRINRPLSLAVDDIFASVGPHVGTLVLPKIAGPGHVRLLSETVAEAEAKNGVAIGHTRFIVMIETAAAALDVARVAAADPRVAALVLGTEDLATDLGVDPAADVLLPLHAALVAAAVATGLLPLGLVGSIAEFRDLDAFGEIARRSRAYGYRGAACIHPSQIPALHAAFTPHPQEVERARKIIAAYDAALASGLGAISLDGRMIDIPVANRARALLASYEALTSHSAR
jgi:citrate lyase subunit beta/citryl-CoA lyase